MFDFVNVDDQSELVRLALVGIDGASAILKEKKCYGRIVEELPSIRWRLRQEKVHTQEEIDSICFRLGNIAGIC
jgi:hypothetical protein